ncbi:MULTISPECIES: hypothetical protein [Clostridium]|uniref:DUF8052 domain-containing protein n=1 Tax=Clostridium faecium TaxID=2762223 RepID=A0ABR8YSX6_9CLOT|nr:MULTISPECIES: hypothetical protein [Clostridium]MBD8047368.1 hypothetical protein [Clostridium faecium]MDU1350451.1 hypothetical protein [Clostridium argentinense]
MELQLYLNNLSEVFKRNFELYNDIVIFDKKLSLYGKYKDIGGRTFLTQNDVIDKFEIYEHCLVQSYDDLKYEDLVNFSDYLKDMTIKLVKPNGEHRSSIITGIAVSKNNISKDICNYTKKFKYNKYYKFTLHGWSTVKLVVIDLYNNKVITNKAAKEDYKVYLHTLSNK